MTEICHNNSSQKYKYILPRLKLAGKFILKLQCDSEVASDQQKNIISNVDTGCVEIPKLIQLYFNAMNPNKIGQEKGRVRYQTQSAVKSAKISINEDKQAPTRGSAIFQKNKYTTENDNLRIRIKRIKTEIDQNEIETQSSSDDTTNDEIIHTTIDSRRDQNTLSKRLKKRYMNFFSKKRKDRIEKIQSLNLFPLKNDESFRVKNSLLFKRESLKLQMSEMHKPELIRSQHKKPVVTSRDRRWSLKKQFQSTLSGWKTNDDEMQLQNLIK